MSKHTDEVLREEYTKLATQYGELMFSMAQLEERAAETKKSMNNLSALSPVCFEIERRTLAPQPDSSSQEEAQH